MMMTAGRRDVFAFVRMPTGLCCLPAVPAPSLPSVRSVHTCRIADVRHGNADLGGHVIDESLDVIDAECPERSAHDVDHLELHEAGVGTLKV